MLKSNKNLKYLFVNEIQDEKFKLKNDIDIDKIKDETYPRLSEFTLTQDDIDDIVKFVKKWQKKGNKTLVHFKPTSGEFLPIDTISEILIEFRGDSLRFIPHVSPEMAGSYLRLVTPNNCEIMYKFNRSKHELSPYMYVVGKDTVYASEEVKTEYTTLFQPKQPATENELSWYIKVWDSICKFFAAIGTWIANLF